MIPIHGLFSTPVPSGPRPRVLIIVPRAKFTIFNPMLALGPLMVASALKDFCDVRVLDNNSHLKLYSAKDLLEEIRTFRPDVLGVNAVVANAYWSYRFIQDVRRHFPSLFVIAGGLHAYHASGEILDESEPDLVITGEGEIAVRKILLTVQQALPFRRAHFRDLEPKFQAIPGLLYRNAQGHTVNTGPVEILANLDEMPFVDFSLSNIEDYVPRGKDIFGATSLIPTQRGCPYRCNFCKSDFMGGKVRNNSAEYVVRNIERLHAEFGLNQICFADNNFTIPRNRAIEICRLLIRKELHKTISFRCWTNVLAPVDDEVLEAMEAANFSSIQFGIERLTPEGMKAVDKIIDWKIVAEKLDTIKRHNIKVFTNLLVGFPFETPESIDAERKLFDANLHRIDGFQVWVVSPIPGTKLYDSVPQNHKWYLDDLFTKREHSYFSIVFIDPMEAILQNIFRLSKATLKRMIRAKKELFLEYNYNLIRRFWLDPFFHLDIALALLSKAIYRRSPSLEHFLFWPLKKLRTYFLRRVVLSYYKKTAPTAKLTLAPA